MWTNYAPTYTYVCMYIRTYIVGPHNGSGSRHTDQSELTIETLILRSSGNTWFYSTYVCIYNCCMCIIIFISLISPPPIPTRPSHRFDPSFKTKTQDRPGGDRPGSQHGLHWKEKSAKKFEKEGLPTSHKQYSHNYIPTYLRMYICLPRYVIPVQIRRYYYVHIIQYVCGMWLSCSQLGCRIPPVTNK